MATYRDAEEMLDKITFYLARDEAAELWVLDTDILILHQVEQIFPRSPVHWRPRRWPD